MRPASLAEYLEERIAAVNAALEQLVTAQKKEFAPLYEAMRYSLFAGGKRLRPILFMSAAETVGADGRAFLHVACALEMIHTYSLIHDDLPAMDNDDYRRGKPTNHKVFGEGMAVLAGDGLLTLAFETILRQPEVDAAALAQVAREIAQAAGPDGMVGGQAVDLAVQGQAPSLSAIEFLHRAKTGAMFRAAVRSGAILGRASAAELSCLTEYAEYFGLAFQIMDDVLDVVGNQDKIGKPVGSDLKNQKPTYVSLLSVADAKKMAEAASCRAVQSLAQFGPQAQVLRDLAIYIVKRDH